MKSRTAAAVWLERVEAWRASGISAEDFARGKAFTARMLRWWSGEFARRARVGEKAQPSVALARVVRPGEIVGEDMLASIAIVVGSFRVTVGRGFDETTLREVLRVVSEAR